jgi:hypothetical protein
MRSVWKLIRGGKELEVAPFSAKIESVWRVVKDGSDFKRGDLVSAKRPMPLARAARRVASWRTKVIPSDLSLIKPVEGWPEAMGKLASPYDELLCLVEVHEALPDPEPAA